MSELSEELKYWRCERPSEYKMDDFIRAAQLMETKLKGLEDLDDDRASLRDIAQRAIDDCRIYWTKKELQAELDIELKPTTEK